MVHWAVQFPSPRSLPARLALAQRIIAKRPAKIMSVCRQLLLQKSCWRSQCNWMPPNNRPPRLLFWLLPLLPIALGLGLFFTRQQVSSFLALNEASQILPNWTWAAFTFLGNGWGLFAIAFPLLIIAPRVLSAGIFAGVLTAAISSTLKPLLNLPRPSGVLVEGSFFRYGDMMLSNSMPSGHTLTAFSVATAIFLAPNQRTANPYYYYIYLLFL